MMAEYIGRQAAMELLIKRLHETGHNNFNVPIFASDLCFEIADERIANWVNEIPSADVEPVRHGRWVRVIYKGDFYTSYHYKCSECGEKPLFDRYGGSVFSDYCPNCGARMDGEEG